MAIYYVRPVNGSNGNDGLSFAGALQNTQNAVDAAAAPGDIIRLIPEANETITAPIDFDTNAGTTTLPLIIEPGNTVDGSKDLTLKYTITTSTAIASLFNFADIADHYRIWNVVLDANNTATQCLLDTVDTPFRNVFFNCRFTNSAGNNIMTRGAGANWIFINCETDLADFWGIQPQAGGRGQYHWIGGSIHNNALSTFGGGAHINVNGTHIEGALIYKNGRVGIGISNNGGDSRIYNNTIYGNTSDGIQFYNGTTATGYLIRGNSMVSNGGYGMNYQATNLGAVDLNEYNHFHGNTLGDSDKSPIINYKQIGDPLFASVADGLEDFTPAYNSPLTGNNLNGHDIGALKAANPVGGSPIITPTLAIGI